MRIFQKAISTILIICIGYRLLDEIYYQLKPNAPKYKFLEYII